MLGKILKKTKDCLSQGFASIFRSQRIDEQVLEALEEFLIVNDLGVEATRHLIDAIKKNKCTTKDEALQCLSESIAQKLKPLESDFMLCQDGTLQIILMCGVNGSGKTTTIAKVAHWLTQHQSLKIGLVAGDTFRAAAKEQLEIWADRLHMPIYKSDTVKDPSAVVYQAIVDAQKAKLDVLFIDTAGRLHNQANLMQELQKMVRVVQKFEHNYRTLLILDATTGLNILNQIKTFNAMVTVDGLIMTKLDGSSKGGVLIAVADQYKIPIYFLGYGEQSDDLEIFNAEAFTKALLNAEENANTL